MKKFTSDKIFLVCLTGILSLSIICKTILGACIGGVVGVIAGPIGVLIGAAGGCLIEGFYYVIK